MLYRLSTATVAAVFVLGCGDVLAQTFRHVNTANAGGRFDLILAVADLNGDGRDDLVIGSRYEAAEDGEPEDRLKRWPVRVFYGNRNGQFRPLPGSLIRRNVEARQPMVAVADFNGDDRLDLAVYDYGVYVIREPEGSVGMGNPPQLYLSQETGPYLISTALADAVRSYNLEHPNPEYSGEADIHLKDPAAGDLDGDGDVDLWVQSMGGANVGPHAMINDGDGTAWTVTADRVSEELHFNRPDEHWYFGTVALADVDGDGDLDVMQGQSRDLHELTRHQSSIVLVNDGTGHFGSRIELPHAAFHDGYSQVSSMTTYDVNGDEQLDLILQHTRNDLETDEETEVLAHTGRYVQVLVNRGDGTFADETNTWVKGQAATRRQLSSDDEPLYNATHELMTGDLDRDGCLDLLLAGTKAPIRRESPLAYRNNGRGQFRAFPPRPFLPETEGEWFGYGAWPADVNGDGVLDYVVPYQDVGPGDELDTEDDYTAFVTLLSTTKPQPTRCE